MTYLLSAAGRAALHVFIAANPLFVFDLDGTLAPIVADPAWICIPAEVRERLIRLCQMETVVILTGRSISDARTFLGFEPRLIVGNHGAEGLPGWEQQEKEFVSICSKWERQLRENLPVEADRNILVENKGASLSVHYRNALNQEEALANILHAIQLLVPLSVRVSGKYVENIMPLAAPRKGEALLRIMQYTGILRALFVGDDITDEDVFSLRNKQIFGIKIGTDQASAADYYLAEQPEIVSLLDVIVQDLTLPAQNVNG